MERSKVQLLPVGLHDIPGSFSGLFNNLLYSKNFQGTGCGQPSADLLPPEISIRRLQILELRIFLPGHLRQSTCRSEALASSSYSRASWVLYLASVLSN